MSYEQEWKRVQQELDAASMTFEGELSEADCQLLLNALHFYAQAIRDDPRKYDDIGRELHLRDLFNHAKALIARLDPSHGFLEERF